jgi:hypothetical protein
MVGRTAVSTVTNEGSIYGTKKVSCSLHSVQTASVARPATYPTDMTTYGGVEVNGHILSRYSLNTTSDWPPPTNQISVLRLSNLAYSTH